MPLCHDEPARLASKRVEPSGGQIVEAAARGQAGWLERALADQYFQIVLRGAVGDNDQFLDIVVRDGAMCAGIGDDLLKLVRFSSLPCRKRGSALADDFLNRFFLHPRLVEHAHFFYDFNWLLYDFFDDFSTGFSTTRSTTFSTGISLMTSLMTSTGFSIIFSTMRSTGPPC